MAGSNQGINGVIKQIHMINFMCHDNFCINLNSRINFICGRNGSGKSAVQTALVIGLGGKAAWTGRGTSLKDVVKSGESSCTIKITLSNCGPLAFHPEMYGDEIMVERHITQSGGSSYKIKTKRGEIVSKLKEDLDRILFRYNIQINNPIAILHQDVARNFLNTDDPKKKYCFFSQATQFDIIEEYIEITNKDLTKAYQKLEHRDTVLQRSYHDVEELKKRMQTLQEAEDKFEHREEVRNELAWAKVYELEELLKYCQKQQEKIKLNIEKLNANLELCNSDDTDLLKKKRDLELEDSNIKEEVAIVTDRLKKKRQQYREKSGVLISEKEEMKQSESKLKRLKTRETAMEEMIYNATHPDPELERKKQAEQIKLEKLKEKLLDVDSAIQTSEMEHNQLVETQDQQRNEVMKYSQELKRISSEQSTRQANIRTLKQASNNLSMYSQQMPKLVAAINAEKRFKEKPRGPIGAYIKVKEQAWAPAVETFIGRGMLSGFCVSSQPDYALLQRIINGIFPKDFRPAVFNSKFFYKMHDVRETKLHGYSNLLRGLEISDPVVANCLIDNMEIETVLMIPTNKEAFRIMGEVQNVPQYCKRGLTLKADTFYPAPDYKSYGGKMKNTKAVLLQVDKNDTIRVLEEEVRELFAKNKEVEQLKHEADRGYKKLDADINKIMNNIRTYRSQKKQLMNNIGQLEENPEGEMAQPIMTKQMENELHELRNCNTQIEDKIMKLRENLDGLEAEVKEYEEKCTNLEDILANFNTKKAGIAHDLCKIESQVRNKNSQQAQYVEKLKQHEALSQSKEKEKDKINKQIDKVRAEAMVLSTEPVATNRNVEEITEELSNLDIYLKTVEKVSGGDLAQVTIDFLARQNKYSETKKEIEMYRDAFSGSENVLQFGKKGYKRKQKQVSIIVSHTFDTYMSACNFKGELVFDHRNKELHINVSPKNERAQQSRSTASLSGGEKSYSTSAFIMSLWSHLCLPFYFLDEFDVFMDMVNRDRIMEMLINRAQEQLKQFVFLTPLDMSKIASSSDLQVFRLTAPRGND